VTFQVPAEPTPAQQTTTAGTSTEPIVDPGEPLSNSGGGAAGKRDPFEPQNTPADPTIAGTDDGNK
jgi:hypothetical protein